MKRAINNALVRTRNGVNRLSRALIGSEATRKLLVVRYYQLKIAAHNAMRKKATNDIKSLMSWRTAMKCRIDFSSEVYRGNALYGLGRVLRNYCGVVDSPKACIEHGVHFGEYVNQSETDKSELPALFTLSPYRLEQIRKASSVPVCIVGPYIAYSKDYLDNKSIEAIRDRLGKTILAIPSHSVRGGTVSYDYKDFINEIRRVKNAINAQTILVMLYYQDILNGDAAIFEDAGFVVVTCGYREDCHFLERQRTLIKLADFTMSNSIGTHVGYCVYMGKPHYSFKQWYEYDIVLHSEKDTAKAQGELFEQEVVRDAFSSCEEAITEQQLSICKKYWGFDYVKSKEEMRLILDMCSKAYAAPPCARQSRLRTELEKHENEIIRQLFCC